MNQFYRSLIILTILFQLLACNETVESEKVETSSNSTDLALATVNGTDITQSDLEFSMLEALGFANVFQLGDEGKTKYLQSMVASRSMADIASKSLDAEAMDNLQRKLNAYKEQILVKMYLKNNIIPEPVSAKMVKDYYLKHPHKFGSKTLIDYSILSIVDLLEYKRAEVLSVLNQEETLDRLNKNLNDAGIKTTLLKKRISQNGSKHDSETRILLKLKEGETSKVFFIGSKPNLIKVENIITTPPKPLNEVSLKIRKSLVPVQLKKSIKEASEMALKQTIVIYH